jgi:hypothetical protein
MHPPVTANHDKFPRLAGYRLIGGEFQQGVVFGGVLNFNNSGAQVFHREL